MVDVNSMVSIYKVYNNNLVPTNIPSYFQKVNASQIITSIRKNCSFEIRFNWNTQKAACFRVKGPPMWYNMGADITLCTSLQQYRLDLSIYNYILLFH